MKVVSVYLLLILLLIATHTVFVCSNFMDNLVTFFKATSMNHTAFDLKLIDKSDGIDRLDANTKTVKHSLVAAGNYENKSDTSNTNLLIQLPKYVDSNLTKNNSGLLQIIEKEGHSTMEDMNKNNNTNHTKNDTNLTKTTKVTLQKLKKYRIDMDEGRDSEAKLIAPTQFSVMGGRRHGQNEQRNENKDYVEQESSSSSSREFPSWKDEFQKKWEHKKFEAINQTRPSGDNINMLAARPWGVPCGDPAQHDMPWGNCMLMMECEPEYRIYRGDYFCGRTMFVCCSLMISTFDMYQGFDMSFENRDYTTDSEEKRDKAKSSRENRKKKLEKERRKRKKAREKATIKIRRNIKKIIKEIRKILNKEYRNGTRERKHRTRLLKRFIKNLKRQYKKDRKAVKEIHEKEMINIDNEMQSKLTKVKVMNEKFMQNETYRDVVVNGSITKEGARMLLKAYPELVDYMEQRRKSKSRRSINKKFNDEELLYDIANENI